MMLLDASKAEPNMKLEWFTHTTTPSVEFYTHSWTKRDFLRVNPLNYKKDIMMMKRSCVFLLPTFFRLHHCAQLM